jgi:hypothetical protein
MQTPACSKRLLYHAEGLLKGCCRIIWLRRLMSVATVPIEIFDSAPTIQRALVPNRGYLMGSGATAFVSQPEIRLSVWRAFQQSFVKGLSSSENG